MADLKRPSRSETDDDLVKQQEQFLKEKQNPSVKIVSKKRNDKTTQNENVNKDSNPLANNTGIPDSDDFAIQPKDIVFDVKERDISYVEPFKFEAPYAPEVKLISLSNKKIKKSKFSEGKKQTIFEQLLKDEENKTLNEDCGHKKTLSKESGSNVPCSILIDGSGLKAEEKDKEMQKIHDENMAKISAMSKDEILYHQEQLKNYLNPDIIKFIKNKRKVKSRETEFSDLSESESDQKHVASNKQSVFDDMFIKNSELPGEILRKEGREDCDALILEKSKESDVNRNSIKTNQENLQDNNDALSTEFEIPKETKELLEKSEKGHWRNMSKIEKEKLQWMADLPQPKPIDLKTGYTARFDFEGKLLSRDIDVPIHKGLHHHGEEPEVAGYSLEELFLLARSTLQSQRITALHTLAHILENNWYGMLDSCFDAPLLPMVLQAGIVPLLRWALDDTSVTSIAATVTAMHSLLICKADEACLSKTFCWLG
ncbi:RNA polymerase II-associated protein 1, partial [Stegodyphus mimosarum]